jgi:hypothetical protein
MDEIEAVNVILICAVYTCGVLLGICAFYIARDWLRDRQYRRRNMALSQRRSRGPQPEARTARPVRSADATPACRALRQPSARGQ